MNINGLFKVVLWVAPVLALVFFYITQQQAEQKVLMQQQGTEVDRDFALLAEKVTGDNRFATIASKKEKELTEIELDLNRERNETNKMREQIKNEIQSYDGGQK